MSKKNEPAKDRAGIGQSDREKGIEPVESQKEKRKALEKSGKEKKRPQFNGQPDDDTAPEQPLQLDE